jgi:hypothetical protein
MAPRKKSEKSKSNKSEPQQKRKSLFDHVNAIRRDKDPNYYNNLSEDDRKSFNHFMIIRALSMDAAIVEEMAQLYQLFDKIPSPQFYQLLVALVPHDQRFYKWVKSKKMKHKKELLKIVSQRFGVSQFESNDYINLLLRTENGQGELVSICRAFGMNDTEIEEVFDDKEKSDE